MNPGDSQAIPSSPGSGGRAQAERGYGLVTSGRLLWRGLAQRQQGTGPRSHRSFHSSCGRPPPSVRSRPDLQQGGCSAHVAQGLGGNPTPPLPPPPLPAPGRRRPGAEKSPPPPARRKELGLSLLHPPPQEFHPLAAPPRRPPGLRTPSRQGRGPSGEGSGRSSPRTGSGGTVRSERRRSQVGG